MLNLRTVLGGIALASVIGACAGQTIKATSSRAQGSCVSLVRYQGMTYRPQATKLRVRLPARAGSVTVDQVACTTVRGPLSVRRGVPVSVALFEPSSDAVDGVGELATIYVREDVPYTAGNPIHRYFFRRGEPDTVTGRRCRVRRARGTARQVAPNALELKTRSEELRVLLESASQISGRAVDGVVRLPRNGQRVRAELLACGNRRNLVARELRIG